jgi:hypothetical protein
MDQKVAPVDPEDVEDDTGCGDESEGQWPI